MRAKNDSTTNRRATKSKAHDEDDVLSDSNLAASSHDDLDLEFDHDCEIFGGDDVDDVPVFSYDQDAPKIEVCVILSDTKECK
jgi:hypothetical protein